jgi:AbrB family looped-hinge helix DNA binding protein
MQATGKISKNGQVTIPREIREIMGLEHGDYVTYEIIGKPEKIGQRQGNREAPCPA